MRTYRIHMLVAFTLAVALIGWATLLSPPLKTLRSAFGITLELPGARHSDGVAEIIHPDIEKAELYLSRIAHVYHAVFMVLIYATLTAFFKLYVGNGGWDVLSLTFIGVAMSIVGALTFSYIDHSFFWHGLFIAGLAVVFSAGLLTMIRFRPRDPLDWAVWVAGLLLLGGALIGGWVGSSYIDHEVAEEFLNAKIQSRFNPDLGEENVVWRAWTGHQHAMIAIALTLAFLVAIKALRLKPGKWTKWAIYAVIVGELVMASASYMVWPIGKIAHLLITPAALVLIFGTLLLSFRTEGSGFSTGEGLLSWGVRLGNIWVWAFVAAPGAIVAMSLRRPTMFFNPNFRAEVWDWAELAYNIGHWHILLTLWGITVMLTYLAISEERSKPLIAFGWLALIGLLMATAAVNLYMLVNPPAPYTPNPYNNVWLSLLVEPSLMIMAIGVAGVYILFLINTLRRLLASPP